MDSNFEKPCDNCRHLAHADARSRYLLSSLVHEIRNPLTLISSSLQLMEKSCPSVTETILWSQLREDVQDMVYMLRDLSAPEKEETHPHHPVRLSSLLGKLVLSFASFAREQGIIFETEIEDNLPILSGNEIKLKEAVLNLLLNASDAVTTQQNSSKNKQISFSACQIEQEIHIHVRDNGAGIPEAEQPKIFDPYVTHKTSGTGIGLSIIRTVAVQHGGTLTLDTNAEGPDTYTDFCLRLPIL